ncbi:MAG: hypothetical protein FJ146_12055 [Deltaproteobacteria bacterium]|nr:hypothetical protein [Deltaproteobacteria bacterium]
MVKWRTNIWDMWLLSLMLGSASLTVTAPSVAAPATETSDNAHLLARGYGRYARPWNTRSRREPASEKTPEGLHLKGVEIGQKIEGRSRFVSNVTASTRQSFTQSYDVMAKAESDYGLGFMLAGGRSHIGLRGYAREKWADTSGSERTYAQDNGSYFPVTNVSPAGKFRFFTMMVDGELYLPLAETIEVTIDQTAGYALPDLLTTRMTSIYGTKIGFKYDDKVYEGRMSVRNQTVYVAQQPPAGPVGFYNYFGYINEYFDSVSTNTFSGHLLSVGASIKRKWETTSIDGRIGYGTASPATGYIVYGEASSISFGASLERKLPFGVTFSPSIGRSMLNSYKQSVKPEDGADAVEIVVEGTVDEVGAELALAPVEWFTVAGQFSYNMFNFSGVAPNLIDAFNQEVPKQSTGYGVMLSLQRQF